MQGLFNVQRNVLLRRILFNQVIRMRTLCIALFGLMSFLEWTLKMIFSYMHVQYLNGHYLKQSLELD